ncbi:MAG: CaiB/BaiF CoA-transferase family protein [Desulfobacterium sp.]|nr:CaiB/BaiF CoA-transferase family protein [Desulfobacterium sp.]
MGSKGALSGIKVLDLSRLLPGPYCSMILADHGAEVIAVEDKRFKADGLFFNVVNRNKRHMCLNLKSDRGLEIFFRLAKEADVILEGFRPGVVERLGVDYARVKEHNPGIVYCSITGYGQTGPMRDSAGHDVNYLANSGVLDLIGPRNGAPTIPGVPIADIAGGSMNAAMGILMALVERATTGKGQYIDISMTDGMVGLLTLPLYFSGVTGQMPVRSDAIFSHRYACYNTYATADDRYLAIGAVEYRFWKLLCDCLKVPEFADLQYDDDRRNEIIDALSAIFKRHSIDHWDHEFKEIDVCYARVKTFAEVNGDPLFNEREMLLTLDGEKETRTFGIPIKLSRTPGSVRTPPDDFGARGREILCELGYTPEEIDAFEAQDII